MHQNDTDEGFSGGRPCGTCIMGAGDADYLDSLKFDLITDVASLGAQWTTNAVGEALEARIDRFYSKHVIPFNDPSLDVCLIVGANGLHNPAMWDSAAWATSKNTIRPIVDYEAVGSGRTYALILCSRLYSKPLDLEPTVAVAAHILFCTKEMIRDCGKGTQIVVLTEGRALQIKREKIEEMEGLFELYFGLEASMFHYSLGAESTDGMKFVRSSLEKMRKHFLGMKLINEAEEIG